jgi:hypothetical protein
VQIDPGAASAAALWTGLCLLLMLVLSGLVVRQRYAQRVEIGDGGAPELVRAVRVFGNATEYVPAALAALALLVLVGAPALVVHVVGGSLFLGRIAHAVGLGRSTGVSAGRAAGVMLTWFAYLVAAGALLFHAL